jgi:hypothetical protein
VELSADKIAIYAKLDKVSLSKNALAAMDFTYLNLNVSDNQRVQVELFSTGIDNCANV